MNKKLIINIFIILWCMTLFCACSNAKYTTLMSTDNSTRNSMAMSYEKFSGDYDKTIDLVDGDTLNLRVKISTDSGSLSAKLYDEDDEEVFNTDSSKDNLAKDIHIHKDGEYKIEVSGEHSGSFDVSWEIEK